MCANSLCVLFFSFQVGDHFMNRIQDIAARVPYMTCPGNHGEISAYTWRISFKQNCFSAYNRGVQIFQSQSTVNNSWSTVFTTFLVNVVRL